MAIESTRKRWRDWGVAASAACRKELDTIIRLFLARTCRKSAVHFASNQVESKQ